MKPRFKTSIFSQVGQILILFGIMLLTPIISLIWYPKEYLFYLHFLIPGMILILIGLFFHNRYQEISLPRLKKAEQVVMVVIIWILACIVLSIPFMTSGILNFSQAFFETSSGLSTTGLSVVDVENVPYMILTYRSIIQFYGGIGIILILVTIFSSSIGFELFQTEGHGSRTMPNLKDSARTVVKIYVLFMGIGFVLLILAGMPSFDAFNIAICAVATGGFGVTSDSIAAYDSYLINYIIIILMLLGSFSFYTNRFIVKGQFSKFIKIDEVKLFFKLIIAFTIISAIFTLAPHYGLFDGINIALFEVVSAITGTGFAVSNYQDFLMFNHTMLFIMIIAMIIGGAIGSTAGGVKISRVNIVLSSLKWNIKKVYASDNKLISRSIMAPDGKLRVSSPEIIMASNYILLYFSILVIGTICLTIAGYPMLESLFEFSSALGNVGLSIGITSPDLPSIILWLFSIAMFIGRLEIFVVIVFLIKMSEYIKRKCSFKKDAK